MTSSTIPSCHNYSMENILPTANNFICPNCSLEWLAELEEKPQERRVYEYTHKNALTDGDATIQITNLKIRISSFVIKGGTLIKNIFLIDSDHDIICKVDDQSMLLKPELIKKYEK